MSEVNPFFIIRDEIFHPSGRSDPDERDISGDLMVARAFPPVQGRFAPAMPVAFGDP